MKLLFILTKFVMGVFFSLKAQKRILYSLKQKLEFEH